ncbi:MAG: peptidoglycan-binding domain-containing protein [Candidatus Nomurabacteria bacterium]
MNKINFLSSKILAGAVLSIPLFFGISGVSMAFNPITSQMDLGSKGDNVTNLQTFFSSNSSIYPEGLVTGYYGGLTVNAVNRFQSAYGLDQVGRVGPLTISKINSLIANGGWGDVFAPMLYSPTVNIGRNSATFSWTTNENSVSEIFYSNTPVVINEGDIDSKGFGVVSGNTALNNNIAGISQQVTINGLQSSTTYYYMLVSTDVSGNVSVASVNNTFVTTN